jgi:NADH:ubiquinone oxidoreductase subunit
MIDIGDYEAQLAGWDSLNMLNYQLSIVDSSGMGGSYDKSVVINVKNGIAESSEPPYWLESWLGRQMTTIPEIFSYIKNEEKRMRDWPKNRYETAYFNVYYHSELYYPTLIRTSICYDGSAPGGQASSSYSITLTPLVENEPGGGE